MTKFEKGDLVIRRGQDYFEPNRCPVYTVDTGNKHGYVLAYTVGNSAVARTSGQIASCFLLKLQNFVYDNGMKVGTRVRVTDAYRDHDDYEFMLPPTDICKIATPETAYHVSLRRGWIWVEEMRDSSFLEYHLVPFEVVERVDPISQKCKLRMPPEPTSAYIARLIQPVDLDSEQLQQYWAYYNRNWSGMHKSRTGSIK
jgi:hypothetical protein